MSLVDYLVKNRTHLEIAKELAQLAKENAALKNRVFTLEVELFWMHAADRNSDTKKGNHEHYHDCQAAVSSAPNTGAGTGAVRAQQDAL